MQNEGIVRTRSWTPDESRLFAELARRALVAILDEDGKALRAHQSDGFLVELDERDDRVRLRVELRAHSARLALDPLRIDSHLWRHTWALEVSRADGQGTPAILTPGQPIWIADAAGSALTLDLRVQRLAILRDGYDPIPVADVAFHRHTQQSSITERAGPLSFTAATERELSPWWEIDLGGYYFVARMRLRVATTGLASGARLRLTAYTFPAKAGGAPPNSFTVCQQIAERLADDQVIDVNGEIVPARFVRISVEPLASSEGSVLEVTGVEIIAAEPFADTLRATMRRAFALHHDQPLFMRRVEDAYEPWLRYDEVYRSAMAFGRSLGRRLVGRDPRALTMVVITVNRPEWVMCDLVAIERGWTLVPLSAGDADDRLADVLRRLRPSVLVCEARNQARFGSMIASDCALVVVAEPGVELDANTLCFDRLVREASPEEVSTTEPDDAQTFTILFTSGSTGAPKGAMRTRAGMLAIMKSYGLSVRPRHLSFQPLSHLSERMFMPWKLVAGGEIAFSQGGEHLAEELRLFGPTELGSVPRLFDVLYRRYKRRLAGLVKAEPETSLSLHERTALAEARGAYGPRLRAISVGSAPVSAEVLAFLKRCFDDLWCMEGYGTTELGTIAMDGRIAAGVEVRLAPLSGVDRERGAPEQGEILVRSAHVISGYLGEDGLPVSVLDADGFFATGDLGERAADGSVRVIGRLGNAVKLAHGEFVSAERVETALATARGVDRIFVHAASGAPGVSALVFASGTEAASELLAILRTHGQRAGLSAWELPRGVLLAPEPATQESGLLTASGKLARSEISARFGVRLSALAQGAGPDETLTASEGQELELDVGPRVLRIVSRALGRELDLHTPLAAAGVDSLAAGEILAALSEELGREVPLSTWFQAGDLADLVARVATFWAPQGRANEALIQKDHQRRRFTKAAKRFKQLRSVLLTGATGLLGSHLLEALLKHTDAEVVCLVRGEGETQARHRLLRVLEGYEIPLGAPARVHVIAGDLRLGLPALGDVNVVLHAAAEVSWLSPYERLRGPNVLGTLALLDLGRPMHFVSTISAAPADGDESTTLSFEAAASGVPYGLSKWIAEEHVRRAGEDGLPVAIYRPAMIAAHAVRAVANPDDYVHRYLASVIELGLYLDRDDVRLDMTPVDFVAEGIVRLLVAKPMGEGDTTHLVNIDQSPTYASVGRALLAGGFEVRPVGYAEFRAALLSRRCRLHALASFFPASGDVLRMGPWPCERSKRSLAQAGVVAPRIDDDYIVRVAQRLRPRAFSPEG